MSQTEKLKKRFLSLPSDFTWEELSRMLRDLGYVEAEGSGSRKCFRGEGLPQLRLHKPHPRNEIKGYAMKQVKKLLEDEGLL
jgi:predicted HTH transcriptional regulator